MPVYSDKSPFTGIDRKSPWPGQTDAIDPKRPFIRYRKDVSLIRLLGANWVTLRYALAIPIRAETCILMKARKPHDKESVSTSHNEDE